MDLALSFYKTAKADLRIAKLLHDNSEFPNSIYHFQQAVEKLSKAFGLKNNFIESKNIESKISHRSEKVFTKHIAKTQKEFDKITEIESLFPDFFKFEIDNQKIDYSPTIKQFRKQTTPMLHLNSDDYLWVDNDDIDHIIEEINQINPEIKLDLEEFNEKFPTIWKSVISHLEEKVQANFQDLHKTETMDTIKTFMPEALSSITKISHIYVSMFLLSLITSGHNQLTRYPCACCGELPENNYNKDTPIVERFNDLYILLDRAINYYDDVFLLSNGIFEDDTKLILS